MGACAGVLRLNGRLLGWDASATDCRGVELGLAAWDAAGFRVGQNHRGLTAKRRKPLLITHLRPHAPEGGSGLDQPAAM